MKSSTQALAALPPRERILQAAHQLFYSEGIRATGVDKIIEKSSVSKVTFYRQFASKDDLIRAYLDYRHAHWIAWFKSSLTEENSNGSNALEALVATLRSWFVKPDFRGCAFLNAAAELGSSDPEILQVVCRHKEDMAFVLEAFFTENTPPPGCRLSVAMSVAIDGAIVHAQMGRPVDEVVQDFKTLAEALVA